MRSVKWTDEELAVADVFAGQVQLGLLTTYRATLNAIAHTSLKTRRYEAVKAMIRRRHHLLKGQSSNANIHQSV